MNDCGIIAVHVGAGCHSFSLRNQYNKLMKDACKEAVKILIQKGSSLEAVSCATTILENSPLTNAAFGSSLTMDGMVECDASIMDGKSLLHGAVGAVPGVKNPALLAKEILLAQTKPLPGGLVPPSFLAGSGARGWALAHDVPVCPEQALIADKSRQIHEESIRHLQSLEENHSQTHPSLRPLEESQEQMTESLLDTVGAVCVDFEGNVSSCVSSGGILLKHSGRIGQAAVYGCGCWAQNDFENSGVNVAVSTSGCGEHLVKTSFGKLCARSTLTTDPLGASLARDVKEKFLESAFLRDVESPMGGALTLRFDTNHRTVDLFWFHTTRSMGVAYMRAGSQTAQALFSELPLDRVGQTVVVNCKSFAASSVEKMDGTDSQETSSSQDLVPGSS